jgi:hypothetical protein
MNPAQEIMSLLFQNSNPKPPLAHQRKEMPPTIQSEISFAFLSSFPGLSQVEGILPPSSLDSPADELPNNQTKCRGCPERSRRARKQNGRQMPPYVFLNR